MGRPVDGESKWDQDTDTARTWPEEHDYENMDPGHEGIHKNGPEEHDYENIQDT